MCPVCFVKDHTGLYRLFSLSLREGWGEGIKIIDEVFDVIPLILTFSLREKGLADLSKSFCITLAELVGYANEGGASFAIDGLRDLSPSYELFPASQAPVACFKSTVRVCLSCHEHPPQASSLDARAI